MLTNRVNLLLTGILTITLFFTIPRYNTWLYGKILDHNNILLQAQHLDEEERRDSRFGYSYQIYKFLAMKLASKEDVLVLLPPQEYVTALKVTNFVVPEPAVFYYYTGLKAVWINSPDVEKATFAVMVKGQDRIFVSEIHSEEQLDSLIRLYKKFVPRQ